MGSLVRHSSHDGDMVARSKLLHVLGGGKWQVPTVRLAKSLGYRVLVSDPYQDRPAFAFADEVEHIDIADRVATLRAAERHRIDGIVCDTSDLGVPTMAYVAETLGLPGIGLETALNFTNKGRMRALSKAAGIPNPIFFVVDNRSAFQSATRELGLPLVVKPVDNQGSRGVHIVRDAQKLDAAFDGALASSWEGAVVVESFLGGVQISVESYCIDGVARVTGISEIGQFPHLPQLGNRLTYPADLTASKVDQIHQINARVVRALGLRTGIAHAEYMLRGSEVYLIEIAARGGGARIHSHIVPYLSGCPVPEFYLRHLMGEEMQLQPTIGERAANVAFFSFPAGTLKTISGLEAARDFPGVQEIMLDVGTGDAVRPAQDGGSRHGHVLVFGRQRSEVLAVTESVFESVKVLVE
jgi:biotin carboxylase